MCRTKECKAILSDTVRMLVAWQISLSSDDGEESSALVHVLVHAALPLFDTAMNHAINTANPQTLSTNRKSAGNPSALNDFRDRFVHPPPGSGTTILWWLNGRLTKEEIREQLLNLRDRRGITCSGHPACSHRANPLQGPGDAILFYKYPGAEVYFLSNASDLHVSANVDLRGKLQLESWDPHTGQIGSVDATPSNRCGEPITQFKLALPPIRSLFIVGRRKL